MNLTYADRVRSEQPGDFAWGVKRCQWTADAARDVRFLVYRVARGLLTVNLPQAGDCVLAVCWPAAGKGGAPCS